MLGSSLSNTASNGVHGVRVSGARSKEGALAGRTFWSCARARAKPPPAPPFLPSARPFLFSPPPPHTMPPTATLAVEAGVGVITLANPPVNALHPDGERRERWRRGEEMNAGLAAGACRGMAPCGACGRAAMPPHPAIACSRGWANT